MTSIDEVGDREDDAKDVHESVYPLRTALDLVPHTRIPHCLLPGSHFVRDADVIQYLLKFSY